MDFLDFDYSSGIIMSEEERDMIEYLEKHLPTTPILQQQAIEEKNEVNLDELFRSSVLGQENKAIPKAESLPRMIEEQAEAKR